MFSRYLHTPKGLCKYTEATGIKIHSMVCHSKALVTSKYWQCKGSIAMFYDILRFVSGLHGPKVQITKSFGFQSYVDLFELKEMKCH